MLCRNQVDLEKLGLLAANKGLAELLRCQDDCVEGRLDLVRNRRVKDLVDVTEQLVFVYFNFLRYLLHDHDFRIPLLESASFCLDLKEPVLVDEPDSLIW